MSKKNTKKKNMKKKSQKILTLFEIKKRKLLDKKI